MMTHAPKIKVFLLVLAAVLVPVALFGPVRAQNEQTTDQVAEPEEAASLSASDDNAGAVTPQPIIFTEPKEPLDERLQRKITLDVRDMNIVDVIKFLAQKGEFNVVISPAVDGRTTVLLHGVAIKDALDIVSISNRLAYQIDSDIVQIMSAAEYEAMYGKQFGDKTQVSIIHLQYSKPSYVLAALDNMKSSIGKIIIDEDTGSVVLVDTPQSIALMKKAIAQIERPLETMVFDLMYAKADVVAEKLRSRIDAKAVGTVTADERSNQILVRVFPGRHAEVEKLIRSLDEPTKEVMIEARVLQIILRPNFDTGIDWTGFFDNGDGKNRVNFKSFLNNANTASTFGQVGVGTINSSDFAVQLRALEQVSDTKILSSPQILVTNNEEAKIHIGDTVPYIVSTTNGTGDNAIKSEDVRFIDVGLKLNVIPTINDEGMVTMRLRPEISSVVARISSDKGGIPQVNKTEVETSVMVQDGMTIVMAGLRKEDKTHTKKGVPGLMNVPYLGVLFSTISDTITSTEIVILITPHIVKGTDDFRKVIGSVKPAKKYDDSVKMKTAEQSPQGEPAKP